ncbi:signal peptide peptidase SppA [Alkalicoccus daliensis]|uniref:Signal peptide peptidase A. Serine peptidase. MEROPS family S49 n=1 Tax=Alkalicoccus daliensis TaxID=745820 RepID=A0A1H0CB36_9BACI|nr:signal peptide peptidase SppA [Alkalicoccus daliensis]SDN55085.1 signal peptide peptidase A. Serine peptidase. MEROPS family S49 [Alkalicoccus daliensis]
MDLKRWIALIAVFAIIAVSAVIGFTTAGTQTEEEGGGFFGMADEPVQERTIDAGTESGKIAVIRIEGVLQDGAGGGIFSPGYNHQLLLDQLEYAAQDGSVDGVILRVNTPGGGVVESDEIHNRIVELRDDYSKDVYVSMGSQAASGGYYVAAPADQIFANGQTITGSLGVIMQSINFAELAEEWGIEDNTIKSGEFKDIMSATREMTEADEEILQSIVDDAYEQFVDVIEAGRDLSREEVLELADGRIYTGSQAMENGLVDQLGNLDETIDAMRENLGRDADVVEYEQGFGIGSFLNMTADNIFEQRQVNQLTDWLNKNQGSRLLYLYTD